MRPKAQAASRRLKRCVQERRVIAYGELGRLIGISHRRSYRSLYETGDTCIKLVVPAINALLVLAKARHPNAGFKGHHGRKAIQPRCGRSTGVRRV